MRELAENDEAIEQVVGRLIELLDLDPSDAAVHRPEREGPDALVHLGDARFAIEWKSSGAAAPVARVAEQMGHYAIAGSEAVIPLLAVPYMGVAGRERCRAAGLNWLDLSGNARIVAPGLRVIVEGKPNRFKGPGRPPSVFAPKSSRIARWLLTHPGQWGTQREIAKATDVDEGFTSRIVGKLERDALVVRNGAGAVRARDPDLLLDAWMEDYDFSKHRILKGHLPARSGEELLDVLVERLSAVRVPYAATGLAAAWAMTRFAGFRIVTLYIDGGTRGDPLTHLDIRAAEEGANVWLVLPNDRGVFQGAGEYEDARCVHPVQAYLDLSAHPERAKEAADELRARLLNWRGDGR